MNFVHSVIVFLTVFSYLAVSAEDTVEDYDPGIPLRRIPRQRLYNRDTFNKFFKPKEEIGFESLHGKIPCQHNEAPFPLTSK